MATVFLFVSFVSAAKPTNLCVTIQSGELVNSAGEVITTGYDEWGYNYQAMMFNGKYCDAYRDAAWCQPWKEDNLIMKWNDAWLSNQDCNDDGLLDRHFGYSSYKGSGAWLTNHQSGTYPSSTEYHLDVNTSPLTVDVTYYSHWYYTATFVQNGTELTGQLTDGYVTPSALTGPILNGTIVGTHVEFSFDYGDGSVQGLRTYVGDINSEGDLIGTWTQTGSQGGGDDFVIEDFALKVYNTCSWNYFVKIVAVPSDAEKIEGVWSVDGVEIGPDIWGEFATIQEVYNDSCEGVHGLMYKSPTRPGLGNWED